MTNRVRRTTPRRRGTLGQTIPLLAICLLVLVGMMALTINTGQNTSDQYSSQAGADQAALSAAKIWGGENPSAVPTQAGTQNIASGSITENAVKNAQEVAALNGVTTIQSDNCNNGTAGQYDMVFYDTPATACPAAPSGWRHSVEVRIPPTPVSSIPSQCNPTYNCIQVVATHTIANVLGGLIGTSSSSPAATAVAVIGGGSSTVLAWGDNSSGQLANGTVDGSSHPTPTTITVTGVTFTKVYAGSQNDFALDSNGHLWAWGDNTYGQLGVGGVVDPGGNVTTPSLVCKAGATAPCTIAGNNVLSNITSVSASNDNTYALDSAGHVWAWGVNNHGALGHASTNPCGCPDSSVPLEVCDSTVAAGATNCQIGGVSTYLSNIVAIGSEKTGNGGPGGYAASANATYSWGSNQHGQLGQNSASSTADDTVPGVVCSVGAVSCALGSGLKNIVQIAGDDAYVLALDSSHNVYGWGQNKLTAAEEGSLGINVANGGGGTGCAAGSGCYSYPVDTCGNCYAGGAGSASSCPSTCTAPAAQLTGVSAIGVGSESGLAVTTTGAVYTWGANNNGMLCQGTGGGAVLAPAQANDPGGAGNMSGAAGVSGQDSGTFILTTTGSLYGCGRNDGKTSGSLGLGALTGDQGSPMLTMLSSVTSLGSAGPTGIAIGTLQGGVVSWGDNSNGELGSGKSDSLAHGIPTSVPTGLAITSVFSGEDENFAIDSSKHLWAWGANGSGQLGIGNTTTPISTPTEVLKGADSGCVGLYLCNVTQVYTDNTTYALDSGGHAWSWGLDTAGQLGDGITGTNSSSPVMVCASGTSPTCPQLSGITAIGGDRGDTNGTNTSGFAATSNTVYAWGSNVDGELGNNIATDGAAHNLPVVVCNVGHSSCAAGAALGSTGGHAIIQLSAGQGFVMALDAAGLVYTWGKDAAGATGTGLSGGGPFTSPVQVCATGQATAAAPTCTGSQLSGIASIAIGKFVSTAVSTTNTLYTWGKNTNGQLCQNNTANLSHPTLATGAGGVSTLGGVTASAAGDDSVFALKSDGSVWACGGNDVATDAGGLGLGNVSHIQTAPVKTLATGVTSLSAGGYHAVAVGSPPSLAINTWGNDTSDQLGNGSSEDLSTANPNPAGDHIPTANSAIGNFVQLANSHDYDLALADDGTVWGWGGNDDGNLGINASGTDKASPVHVQTGIANYPYLGCTGNTGTWGNCSGNTHGPVVEVAIAARTSMALMADGTVWTWGDQGKATGAAAPEANVGQLGTANTSATNALLPVQVCGTAAVAAAGGNSCKNAGGTSVYLSSIVAIGGSTRGSDLSAALYAIDNSGAVYAWGSNASGQLGTLDITDASAHPVPAKVVTNTVGPVYFSLGTCASGAPTATAPTGPSTTCSVNGGISHAIAQDSSGEVWGWGANSNYQLATGTNGQKLYPAAATLVTGAHPTFNSPAGTNVVVGLVPGDGWGAAVTTTHAVFTWGEDQYDQSCTGTTFQGTVNSRVWWATQVVGSGGTGTFAGISAAPGDDGTMLVDSSGTMWACGRHADSVVTEGNGTCNSSPYNGCDYGSLAIGGVHASCAGSAPTPCTGAGDVYNNPTATLLTSGVSTALGGIAMAYENGSAIVNTSAAGGGTGSTSGGAPQLVG